ncbi:uncharacterized protein LOC108850033 [Raphanus sativus]|uniref:Uncharacterized protein LOC108850033 n=1 Tax=Raphanus sativus TaxID=3726 RepID=A0A6J0N3V1_RAPSA|nr:uncharacterized protein LOC108850033 [Raphanus sativus]
MVHGLRTHERISKEFMAIKTDMSKAYDRIEWMYLESLLAALGFDSVFYDWIMRCVKSVSYTVLINGEEQGKVLPNRGLRQGNPLSPFLFDLCTEGLSHKLNEAERRGEITGISFSEEGPAVHHLFFADDSLLLLKANEAECAAVCKILREYEAVSGQMISFQKSAITFGNKVSEEMKTKIKEATGIYNEGGTGKYLGLPECFSGSKVDMLQYIYEKMTARFHGWYAFFLSTGGKEVLLKSVAMAMPVFAMYVFRLPKTTCKRLTSAMANFWWNVQEGKNKMHWVSWERMCLDKEDGGMGFKDLEKFNQALLAKQGWRLLMDPSSLCARVLKSMYYPSGFFLEVKLGSRPSYAWRSILYGRELLTKGLRRNVGSGEQINVWVDKWLFDEVPIAPMRKQTFFNVGLRREVGGSLFLSDIERVLKIKPALGKEDSHEWVHNRSGAYSVKSGYWLACKLDQSLVRKQAQSKPSLNGLRSRVWQVRTAPKIKIFMWKALSNALAVAEECLSRGMKVDSRCQNCGEDGESINHVLFTCPAARVVWASSGIPFPLRGFENRTLHENFYYLLNLGKDRRIPTEGRGTFDANAAALCEEARILRKSKKSKLVGLGWIVRNAEGSTVLHSRRAFNGAQSVLEAKRLGLIWAVESMTSHRLHKVTLEIECPELEGAVNRPKEWPAYRGYGVELEHVLNNIAE